GASESVPDRSRRGCSSGWQLRCAHPGNCQPAGPAQVAAMRLLASLGQLAQGFDAGMLHFALLSGLALAALALSALSFLSTARAKAQLRESQRCAREDRERLERLIVSLSENQNSLSTELRDFRIEAPASVMGGVPRSGFNLTK